MDYAFLHCTETITPDHYVYTGKAINSCVVHSVKIPDNELLRYHSVDGPKRKRASLKSISDRDYLFLTEGILQ